MGHGRFTQRQYDIEHSKLNFTHFFPLDAFSASVEITLPRVSKLSMAPIRNQELEEA